MLDIFVPNPKEVGLIIVIDDTYNNKVKYIGKDNTVVITDEHLDQYEESEQLDNLILFSDDNEVICQLVSEYREKGIDARIFTVFRNTGHRILSDDETDEYIRFKLITA